MSENFIRKALSKLPEGEDALNNPFWKNQLEEMKKMEDEGLIEFGVDENGEQFMQLTPKGWTYGKELGLTK